MGKLAGKQVLSGDFFAVTEVEGSPLTKDEPEGLVDDGKNVWNRNDGNLGVDTTHVMGNQTFGVGISPCQKRTRRLRKMRLW